MAFWEDNINGPGITRSGGGVDVLACWVVKTIAEQMGWRKWMKDATSHTRIAADPLTDVDNGEGLRGSKLAGVDVDVLALEFELEAVLLVVVNERWTLRAVGISDSSRLHIIIKPKQVSCPKC